MDVITAQTKVGLLLAEPELEKTLLDFAPAFAKLKNPVLRKTVARVATLRQAAEVAGVDVSELVTKLRTVAGQRADEPAVSQTQDPGPQPIWARQDLAIDQVNADDLLDAGENPLVIVQRMLHQAEAGAVLCVKSTFPPAPLIDSVKKQGHLVWTSVKGGLHITLIQAAG